jgi:nitroreductase
VSPAPHRNRPSRAVAGSPGRTVPARSFPARLSPERVAAATTARGRIRDAGRSAAPGSSRAARRAAPAQAPQSAGSRGAARSGGRAQGSMLSAVPRLTSVAAARADAAARAAAATRADAATHAGATPTSAPVPVPASRPAATAVPLHPLLGERWSPRGFDDVHVVGNAELLAVLEAGRWAASSSNTQPWRFVVTRRGEAAFDRLLGTLAGGNRAWAHRAGVLVLVAAQTRDDQGAERRWALYDTGLAVAQMVLQAGSEGLVAHQMAGFDRAAAAEAFDLADDVDPVVVLALGALDPVAELPEPFAARERAPRVRRPLGDLLLPAEPGRAAAAV